ncbi:sulfurtransferase [Alginatibacterium sediminis]|uniref:Sulfurtransferase n=1 Tax=Alginatibacterium sediminis TaxID=2164068 RepID=A0A420E805_9ALTE|nr:rhodanese-like domain-containing protein [Alginatibacterium sediminis]RKF15541.1 sulfurtransferase [Alginatibacterium sediminis]
MQHNPRFLALVNTAKAQINECQINDVKQWMEQGQAFTLIDNREQDEWQRSHLPQAHYLGRGVLERDIEQQFPDLDTKIVVYCGGGFRSALSVLSLQQMGYSNVWSMDGGFRAWKEAGLELLTN